VGEQPGLSALNFVRGAVPNPSAAGPATVRFSLARAARVTLRFYNVAGRLVHEAVLDGLAGDNAYRWDGATSAGMRAAAGVYFYRLSAPGLEFQNNAQRMVLLGGARD
jgi:flagellar hook assembly protein FlgD